MLEYICVGFDFDADMDFIPFKFEKLKIRYNADKCYKHLIKYPNISWKVILSFVRVLNFVGIVLYCKSNI